jgi:glycopeptide antibiotics resistance protein
MNLSNHGPNPQGHPRKSTARLLWTLFSLFIIYGTTFPFAFGARQYPFSTLVHRINWHLLSSKPDMVQNILLFIPFGFLGYFSLIYKSSRLRKLAVVLLGSCLSLFVEFLQIYSVLRFPALADVLFNTAGAMLGLGLGILLKKSVLGFKSHPSARRFLDAPSAFPAVVFLILVVGGCWEPFDFSLEIGSLWARVHPLIANPWHLSLARLDLFTGIQYLLATLFVCRALQEGGWPKPVLTGALALVFLGVGLEASQIIIVSKYPEVQDVLIASTGVIVGALLFFTPGFRDRPWVWSTAGALGVLTSAIIRGLLPFQFKDSFTSFNWILFQPQYEKSTAFVIGDFLANGMVYLPLGFLLGYFFPASRRVPWVALLLAGIIGVVVEYGQGWVENGYGDITAVLAAVLGSLAGSLVLTRGWPAFILYMRQEDDAQV